MHVKVSCHYSVLSASCNIKIVNMVIQMLHLALLMIVDVNDNFMLFVACYYPKNGECFFMSAAVLRPIHTAHVRRDATRRDATRFFRTNHFQFAYPHQKRATRAFILPSFATRRD